MLHIEVIFTDGTSYAQKSQHHRSEHEALMAAWSAARATGKTVKTVQIL